MKKLTLFFTAIAVSALAYSTSQANDRPTTACGTGSLGVCVDGPDGRMCSYPENPTEKDCSITFHWPVPPPPPAP